MAMSVKYNFIYNVILTLSTYVANFVLFPYITRVLGVEQFGIVGFARQTVDFFILFAMLGMSIVGVREIAVCGNDTARRSRVFSSLASLSVLTTFITSAVYVVVIFSVPKMHDNLPLMLVGLSRLIFNTLLFEWFYRGIERFRYISLCSIAIRIIYILAVFMFVKDSGDEVIYFALTCGIVVLNAFVNMVYLRHFVRFSLSGISIRPYIAPLFRTGLYSIITAMYTTFNVIYLGIVNTDAEIGYYFAATKIYAIILGIYTAFSNVMFPRMSKLIADKDETGIRRNIDISFDLILAFACPIIAFCIILGPELIKLLSGDGYEGAILPMQIIICLLLVVGIGQIIVLQIVIPRNEDSTLLKASLIGAVTGILCNVLLVERYGAIGSAFVLLISELAVFAFYAIHLHRKGIFDLPVAKICRHIVLSLPYALICWVCSVFDTYTIWRLVLAMILCGTYFLILQLFILKQSAIKQFIRLS